MEERRISLTPEQEAAVKYRGGSLLVSAAAGSGKTKVLVERLLSRVEEGDDINEFLIITYTRAAASELREKIYDGILGRLAEKPENRRLRRQSMLCRGAPIGTIHSFCADFLRENAHLAGLPPDFRVIDESESKMVTAEVLEDVLNEAYETAKSAGDSECGFFELIDMLSSGYSDQRLVRIIIDAHAKLQSNPDPQAWVLAQMEKLPLQGISDVSETIWGDLILTKACGTATYWLGEMGRLRAEMKNLPDFEKAYGDSVDATIDGLGAFVISLDNGWDDAKRMSMVDFPKANRASGYDDLKDIRQRCKTAMKKCAGLFDCSSDEHIEDMRSAAPAMSALFQLILDFDSAYSEEKRRRGAVDFSDLEHLALKLLVDAETGEKTETACAVSQRYKEIMVDEYQDVNAVQELIFNAVSRGGDNVFMVGDVKQSIYRFRLADPSIFMKKYRNFKDAESGDAQGGGKGAKIHLSKNFRSQAGVLDAVNQIFSRIMSEEFGEMEYTERESLSPGRKEGDPQFNIGPAVELEIIDMSGIVKDDDEEESPAKTLVEAQFIAKRIAELTSGSYTIPAENGGIRKVEYSDIVILLRSMKNKARQYAGVLTEHGILVDMPDAEGFFETAEISAALSLLAVIDNPIQDIPLAAALSGPIYGFSPDELAGIRAASRSSDFYGALVKAAHEDSSSAELSRKCAAFLDEINAFREIMPDMPADRFIWYVYDKTGLLELAGAMKNGGRRRENLVFLAESAQVFERSGYKGLFGFLTYIRGIQERGAELASGASAPVSNAAVPNAVRIMSIHKSKGLEFPVVILADTSKKLNNQDAQQTLVLHPELGVGSMRIDRSRRIEYTTLARTAIQSRLTSEMMAEELRVLYVAMTRAKEKLIITAALRGSKGSKGTVHLLERADEPSPCFPCFGKKIAPQILEDVRSMAGWILAAAPKGNSQFTINNVQSVEEGHAYVESPPERSDIPEPGVKSPDLTLPEFVYPCAIAPDLPSKLTVTMLKGRHINDSDDNLPLSINDSQLLDQNSRMKHIFDRPGFIAKKSGLTAAERGTALHLALQYIDYQKCVTVDGAKEEIARLAEKGIITEEQAATIDAKKIARFFDSDVGKRLLKSGDVRREFKFSLLYPAEQFYPGGGDDKILLQGVIDCFFEEEGKLTVIDFKTDHVTPETLEEKAKQYAPQLSAYANALERITGKGVIERVIYFFAMDTCRLII